MNEEHDQPRTNFKLLGAMLAVGIFCLWFVLSLALRDSPISPKSTPTNQPEQATADLPPALQLEAIHEDLKALELPSVSETLHPEPSPDIANSDSDSRAPRL
ncbi:MAG: hypothetical protein KDD69_09845 [Bdellovibrionales bacterium]|nr:hypothetical protein [Bdellovibrionales bacterium]